MIRIIKGIYGYKGSSGFIEPKSIKDAPFSLTEEREAELVRKGVAEYVYENSARTSQGDGYEEANDTRESANIWGMDYNALKSYAKELGLSAKGSKEELLERINEKLDLPPDLEAEIPQ